MSITACRTLFLGLAAIGIAASCASRDEVEPRSSTAVAVRTEDARLSPVSNGYEAVGTVRSRLVAVLSSKIVGQVVAIHAHEGEAVEKGRTLVELDRRDVVAQERKAAANRHVALVTYQRYRALLERGSVSQQEFDEIEARYRAAEADFAAATTAVSYASIRSPIAGIVTAKPVDVGTMAAPGLPLITVEDDSRYRLEVLVEESRLAPMRLRDEAKIGIDAIAADLEGRVAEIVPTAETQSRTFLVKIDLPPDSRLRSGMFGRARFTAGETNALTVSSASLIARGPLTAVYTVDTAGVARLRLVRPGRRYGERVEILSGLEAGERVVAEQSPALRDGSRIVEQAAALPSAH